MVILGWELLDINDLEVAQLGCCRDRAWPVGISGVFSQSSVHSHSASKSSTRQCNPAM